MIPQSMGLLALCAAVLIGLQPQPPTPAGCRPAPAHARTGQAAQPATQGSSR